MRIATLAVLALLSGFAPAAADPFEDFFDYEEPRLPGSGNCEAIAAELGPEGVWYGEFSGKRYDSFNEQYYPFGARGCFKSELACTIWQNRALTYGGRGPLYYTSCRRGSG